MPTILEEGEEVLTRTDDRHVANGGRNRNGGEANAPAPQEQAPPTIINLFDPAQALEMALRAPLGSRVILNHVRENPAAFKAALDG